MKLKLILPCFLLAGCSTAKIISSWHAVNQPVQPCPNAIILALLPPRDLAARGQIENGMADALSEIGYYSLSALSSYGQNAFCDSCRDEILYKLKADDVTMAITISLVATKDGKRISSQSPEKFYDYQADTMHRAVYERYNQSNAKYYWETNLYSLNDGRLLYSAWTETGSPVSYSQFCDQGISLVLEDMMASGVLALNPG